MYVISLGAIGKKAEAAAIAQKYAEQATITPADAVRFRFYAAVLKGEKTDGLMDSSLSRQDEAAVYLSVARQALTWNMSDVSEEFSKKYEKFFAVQTPRSITVTYSETPISGISSWRAIYPTLEKQYCDIPYRGSMEFLETDVSTGDRKINLNANNNGEKSKFMELTAVCDRYGLHIFLRGEAENARDIERGFAPGISTELYFAPGRNQPYVCMGGGVASVDFIWQSTYNHKKHTRIDEKNTKSSFHKESEFTDHDYVLHLFFAWDGFYNKLPQDGTNWRFECLAWAPDGGYSWGGSQQIHSASAWGDLCFDLSKENITEIKKQVILKTFRNYRNVR